MVVLRRSNGRVAHCRFDQIRSYLKSGDVLVVNNSMMVHDELPGITSRGPVKLVLFGHHAQGWYAAVSPSKHAARGLVIRLGDSNARAILVKPAAVGLWFAKVESEGSIYELLEQHGRRHQPLYHPLQAQLETYRNVYASEPGSLEIPSAGLHFTRPLLHELQQSGVAVIPITLHIGLTEVQQFRRVAKSEVEDHRVGPEWYRVSRSTAAAVNKARREGGRVFAVGTSVVRTLETAVKRTPAGVKLQPGEGWTDLFIYPGHEYQIVDAMLTNLHEPRSTHLLLVAAFAGKDLTLTTYRDLIRRNYRFDLFGDSMLIH
jgi:S-adenosylmethionine:tRNA ribosyltransferase-isomerase